MWQQQVSSLAIWVVLSIKINNWLVKHYPIMDRVTGHARGCAHEWACPKLDCIWTRKFSFPVPVKHSCPGQRNRQRSAPVPMTGVHYNSLLWMCMLNTLTWPDLVKQLYLTTSLSLVFCFYHTRDKLGSVWTKHWAAWFWFFKQMFFSFFNKDVCFNQFYFILF